MPHSRPKVFFIGFNKTATTSFHCFFKKNGCKSYHYTYSDEIDYPFNCLAWKMEDNLKKEKNILKEIDDADVYSDMCYIDNKFYLHEANEHFKKLDKDFPNSYFIFQTRPLNDWIQSRLYHQKGNFYKKLLHNFKSEKDLVESWRRTYDYFYKNITSYFKNYNRFIQFDISKDHIEKINLFLQNDYKLKTKYWKKVNASSKTKLRR